MRDDYWYSGNDVGLRIRSLPESVFKTNSASTSFLSILLRANGLQFQVLLPLWNARRTPIAHQLKLGYRAFAALEPSMIFN
jgi:hypothetical protein